MPEIADGMVNMNDASGNASNLALYDFAGSKKLVEAVFTVNGTGTTNVDLNVVDLTLGKLNPETGKVDANSEYAAVVNGDMANDLFDHINSEAKVEAYVEPTTTEPATEPTTVAPATEPTTVAPATEPTTVAPATEPTTVEPTTTEPATEPTDAPSTEPTTTEPATEPTDAPATEPTTDAPATVAPTTPDATSATQVATKGQSTADTATSDTPANGNGTSSNAVQTGNASMAVVILLALVSATGVVYFTRKRFNK